MQQIPKVLKINYNEDMRRLPLTDFSYDSLKKQVCQLYSIQEGSFIIKYKDDEGDMVTIASEMEFKEALSCFQTNIIRFSVYDVNQKRENNNHHQRHHNKEGKGRCGGKWRKWKCRNENGNEPNTNQQHHPFRFINNLTNIANQFIQGGQCDNILESFLNSGFCKLEHNHICDGCETQISGTRYHCTQCEDFDFCSNCFEGKLKSHDINHQFDKISAVDALKDALKNGEKIDSFFMPGSSNDSQQNNENPIKIEINKEEPKIKEEPTIKEEPKIETNIKIDQPEPKVNNESSKESYPFSKKLEDLQTMGFNDRKRNINALVQNKGDIHLAIQDLLNQN